MKLVFGFINRFPKWYVMIPLHQNSQTSLGPLEWAFSRPGTWWRDPWSQLTEQTIQIIFISCSKSKVVPILLPDRHTFCIPICAGKIFFYTEIYTFHYTTFLCLLCSLTPFVFEGLSIWDNILIAELWYIVSLFFD